MTLLHYINNMLLRFATWGAILFMGAIAIVIPYEVFGRYVLNEMATWSGELATFSLVWASMMGAAAGLRKGYQVGMTFVLEKLPSAGVRFVQAAGFLWSLFFLSMMAYFGIEQTQLNVFQTSPAMGIPMCYPYAALPIGFFIMLLVTVEDFLYFLGVKKPEAVKEDSSC